MEISTENELSQCDFTQMLHSTFEEMKSKNIDMVNYTYIDEKALRMMNKMGYQSGNGLGRHSQGILQPVEFQRNFGRKGLGHIIQHQTNLEWDFTLEDINIEEKVDWLIFDEVCNKNVEHLNNNWIKIGKRKLTICDETHFCNERLLEGVLKAKEVFDEMDPLELCKARARANPFETLRSAFFMNRAALKMANIDAATDYLFSDVDRQVEHKQSSKPYYFADICAGPGGFSEYIFWRKRWAFKGFGLTLRGVNDFKIHESSCAASETFEALYGARNDGNVYYPENISNFCSTVKSSSDNLGVHFVMADGGFSVEGQENIQEILSRQIYTCQCLVALKVLRNNGHFVVKLFDLFTPFSVGLIYLMRNCFHKIAILKPNSSRPANSERYLICANLKDNPQTDIIRNYLEVIVQMLHDIRIAEQSSDFDILEIVPDYIIQQDETFYQYIKESNNRLAEKQIIGLMKLSTFCRNPTLIEPRQEEFRQQCLVYWRVPNKVRTPRPHITINELITNTILDKDFMFSSATELKTKEEFESILDDSKNWYCTFSTSTHKLNVCNIYAGLGRNKVYRFQRNKWTKVKGLELIRGTIIFAEMVTEYSEEDLNLNKKSLHVIDALRLGDISLADLSYSERLDLMNIYCQAINRSSRSDLVSIRVKPIFLLNNLQTESLVFNKNWYYLLSKINNINKPYYNVNSFSLYQSDTSQSFGSTISSRVVIYLPNYLNDSELYWIYEFLMKINNVNVS